MFSSPPITYQAPSKIRYPELKRTWKVFLSFSGKIRSEVEKIYDALIRQGIKQEDIFFDKYSIPPGGNFEEICKFGVANSTLFVAFIDETYLEKEDPQMEAKYSIANNARKRMRTYFYVTTLPQVEDAQKIMTMNDNLKQLNSKICVSNIIRTRAVNNETEWAPTVAKEIKDWFDENVQNNPTPWEISSNETEKKKVETFWPKWMTSQHYKNIDLRSVHFIDTEGLDSRRRKFLGLSDETPLPNNNDNSPVKVIVLSEKSKFDERYSKEDFNAWQRNHDKLILFPLFLINPENVKNGENGFLKEVKLHLGTIKSSNENQDTFFQRAGDHLRRTESTVTANNSSIVPSLGIVGNSYSLIGPGTTTWANTDDKKRKLGDDNAGGSSKKPRTDGTAPIWPSSVSFQ